MLKEIVNASQRHNEPRRRWFHAADQDLYVWTDGASAILGFQLCYDKTGRERALVWKPGSGLSHCLVDDGEAAGRQKSTPTMRDAPGYDAARILAAFQAQAAHVPAEITGFVVERIQAKGD